MHGNRNSSEFRTIGEQDRLSKLLSGDSSSEIRDRFSIVRPILGLHGVLNVIPDFIIAPQLITFASKLKQGEAHGVILSAFGSNGGLMDLLNANTETVADHVTARNSIVLEREVFDEPENNGSRLLIPIKNQEMAQLKQEKNALGQYTKNTVPDHLFPNCAVNLGVVSEQGQLELTKMYLRENLPEEITIGAITVASSI